MNKKYTIITLLCLTFINLPALDFQKKDDMHNNFKNYEDFEAYFLDSISALEKKGADSSYINRELERLKRIKVDYKNKSSNNVISLFDRCNHIVIKNKLSDINLCNSLQEIKEVNKRTNTPLDIDLLVNRESIQIKDNRIIYTKN